MSLFLASFMGKLLDIDYSETDKMQQSLKNCMYTEVEKYKDVCVWHICLINGSRNAGPA